MGHAGYTVYSTLPAFLIDEVEEVGAEFILSDEVGGLAVVAGEAEDGLDVTVLSAGSETAKLHVLEHALA